MRPRRPEGGPTGWPASSGSGNYLGQHDGDASRGLMKFGTTTASDPQPDHAGGRAGSMNEGERDSQSSSD